jgi:Tol biopolymer transport system component
MGVDGSDETNLTGTPANESYPAWSPDGASISFASSHGMNMDIWLMDSDGSNHAMVTAN